MNADRILRRPEVVRLVGLKRSAIYRLMGLGEFPRQIRLTKSGRAVGWKLSSVESWIESRSAAIGAENCLKEATAANTAPHTPSKTRG